MTFGTARKDKPPVEAGLRLVLDLDVAGNRLDVEPPAA
jgi:hypothetical protein